ncbi:hypothetical protein JYU34_004731 [Plutella xylostella]|uniref:Uncharacterized protein n=1 Tax=Plutella xylostella TaxID=51655 RepID=A0ABQ7QYQ1_PLUXY|nr:hypothetical protein JYU34_004731 [Plutella xylostella]
MPLPPHDGIETDVVTCSTTDGEYFASMHIERRSKQRHPRLTPATTWLGVLPPGSDVTASLKAYNDTFEQIYFRANYIHWTASEEDDAIECPGVRCSVCHQHSCRCTTLLPTAGRLPIGSSKELKFHTPAGTTPGADLWLVSLQRCIADSAYPLQEAPINGRAAVIGARIVAPQLSLHVEAAPLQKAPITKCSAGDVCHCCLPEPLILDGDVSAGLVRPTEPLVQGRIVYCRLKVINLTPIPTRLHWEPDPDKDNPVKVTFKPNEEDISGYGQAEIEVELLGSRVSPRRLFSLCGLVEHGEPVYLLVDAAVDGQSISLELPNARVIYRSEVSVPNPKKSKPPQMVQSEDKILTLEAIFAKRYPNLMGLSEPDKCSCEPYCECPPVIEFRMVPLHKEIQQIIRLQNTGVLCVSWSIKPYLLEMDGVAALRVWATPSQGVLAGRSSVGIRVHVCCKRAGARKALLTLKTSKIVLPFHVWVQANGPPLKLLAAFEEEHTLWMSETQLVRTLRARNIYGAQLKVETYIIRDYEYVQSQLPFRLFYQLFDIPVTVERCPCMKVQYQGYEASGEVTPIPSQCSSHSSLYSTGVRLYLGPDVGVQDYTYFEVTPDKTNIPIDSTESWAVTLKENDMVTPPHTLLLRAIAVGYDVEGWEGLLMVYLKVTPRQPKLQIDPDSVELRFSALNLPSNNVMRLRKSIRIQNTGTGELRLSLYTSGSWLLTLGRSITSDRECSCNTEAVDELMVTIAPRTAIEVKVQIEVDTSESWPSPCPGLCDCAAQAPPASCYPDKKWVSGELVLQGNHGVFQVVPLSLELHYPVLSLRPKSLDLGAVLAGESRKTYLTLRHTARDAVAVVMRWEGDPGFSVHPQRLDVEAGASSNIYVLFTAPDTARGPAAGMLRARVASDAGVWCQDTAELKAEVSRDAAAHRPPHDYTDDPSLLPQRARQGL